VLACQRQYEHKTVAKVALCAPPRTNKTSRRRSPVATATASRWSTHGSRIVWSFTKGSRGNFGLKTSCKREPPVHGRGLSALWRGERLEGESLAGTIIRTLCTVQGRRTPLRIHQRSGRYEFGSRLVQRRVDASRSGNRNLAAWLSGQ